MSKKIRSKKLRSVEWQEATVWDENGPVDDPFDDIINCEQCPKQMVKGFRCFYCGFKKRTGKLIIEVVANQVSCSNEKRPHMMDDNLPDCPKCGFPPLKMVKCSNKKRPHDMNPNSAECDDCGFPPTVKCSNKKVTHYMHPDEEECDACGLPPSTRSKSISKITSVVITCSNERRPHNMLPGQAECDTCGSPPKE